MGKRRKKGGLKLTWTEFDREGTASSEDGIADSEARGVLVTLNGGSVTFELDDLADQLVPADLDQLVHFGATHVFCDDEGSSDLVNAAILGLALFEIVNHVFFLIFSFGLIEMDS